MASSPDTEITLGTAKLLGIFFGLVMICAVFFALGYTLGRKSESGLPSATTLGPVLAANGGKPASSATNSSAAPMSFYKAVEQQNANPQLTPANAAAAPATDASTEKSTAPSTANSAEETQAANLPDPMAPIPGTGYFVQVAAVSKQEDADALVDALKKKQYPAFVANTSTTDKLHRVQTGPFGDIKEAEAMRARLINDGYNPILKK
jgi:cell division septation protein DedD